MDQEVPIGSLLHLKSSRFHKWNDLETPMVVDNPIGGPRGTIFATGPGSFGIFFGITKYRLNNIINLYPINLLQW